MQADTIIPKTGDIQGWDRYAYVNNSPLKYSDPTGHYICGGEDCSLRMPTLPITPVLPQDPRRPTLDITQKPFPSNEVYINENKSISFGPPGYNYPDVPNPGLTFVGGVNFSGTNPYHTGYYTGGIEGINLPDGTYATYTYGGEGNAVGVGGSITSYGGIFINVNTPNDYFGISASVGLTASCGDVGISMAYVWNSENPPLYPGNVQRIIIGWAPGAQLSVWKSLTNYQRVYFNFK
jgi:hypothetical protein